MLLSDTGSVRQKRQYSLCGYLPLEARGLAQTIITLQQRWDPQMGCRCNKIPPEAAIDASFSWCHRPWPKSLSHVRPARRAYSENRFVAISTKNWSPVHRSFTDIKATTVTTTCSLAWDWPRRAKIICGSASDVERNTSRLIALDTWSMLDEGRKLTAPHYVTTRMRNVALLFLFKRTLRWKLW